MSERGKPAADRAGVVEVDVPVASQCGGEVLRLGGEVRVARERQHGGLEGGEAAVEPEHDALVDAALGVGRLVLVVRFDEEGHEGA